MKNSYTEVYKILSRYFIEHSNRRLNFLYWNIQEPNDRVLCFVNLSGKELIKLNNPDLVFRIVRVLNKQDWKVISGFIEDRILDKSDKRAVHVIRLDYLMSYLKSITDIEYFSLIRNSFGTAYSHTSPDKTRPICTISNDIQSITLVYNLYTKYNTLTLERSDELTYDDISTVYVGGDYKHKMTGHDIIVPIVESLDCINSKLLARISEPVKIDIVYNHKTITNVVSIVEWIDVMTVLSVRVYLQYFIKHRKNRRDKDV